LSRNRKAFLLETSANGNVALYIDSENAKDLLAFWNQDAKHEKWFKHRKSFLLQGLKSPDIFGSESHSDKTKNIWAIKHKGGENWRVYCQRYQNPDGSSQVIIVQCELLVHKSSQENSPAIKAIVERIADYNYQLIPHPTPHDN
jgi:hypothetical protein